VNCWQRGLWGSNELRRFLAIAAWRIPGSSGIRFPLSELPFRDRLSADLESRYEQLLKTIDEGMEAKKQVWVSCPHCKKRSEVEVTDTRAAILAAEFVANQSHGRPGVDTGTGDDDRIIFVRIVGDSEEDAARVFWAAEKFVPADKHDAFLRATGFDSSDPRKREST
jgi:hypothetical protein